MDNILRKAVETAIQAEALGTAFYDGLANKFSGDSELHVIFKLLSRDEAGHQLEFEELLKTIGGNEAVVSAADEEFLKGIDISVFFPAMVEINEDLSPGQVLHSAYDFERETVLYYMTIRDIVGTSPLLDEIIKIEKLHMSQLLKIISSGTRFRGLSDTWYERK